MHGMAFSTIELQKALADIEDRLYASRFSQVQIDRPVFITSLPRAGTTLLLEIVASLDAFASHTYRDMPFLLTPNPPTRSGLGVGTRGEGRGTRRSALDSDKWGRWRPLVVVGGADGGPGSGAGAGSAGQHAGEDNRGPGRCDSVGRLGSLVDGSGAVGAVRQAMAGLAIEPGRE